MVHLQRQRVDAELLYLSRIAQEWFPSDTARAAAHPRWAELCNVASAWYAEYSIGEKEQE